MPKITYVEPPVNWLLALLLERKHSRHWSFVDLSMATGLTENHLRHLFMTDPWDWKRETRESVCKALGITEEQVKQTFKF